ncbi:MAG: hypothetical protein SCARUB_02299 [Candidatus Scalindua rubra]|uniref:ATPase n=1 Tax=Candidatus Scalindua rubra TaxID=1872076 RepID=A0A1E3XAD2_9BACT|nr:MAG: hypothetical protein SCARUB_02299 [Candidatus Scalindua rubra]
MAKYYSRKIEQVLVESTKQFRVVVLTGARQTGKSTLFQHLFKNTHRYISLDNPIDLKLAQDDPELFFDEYPAPLIIDEIQYAPELLPYIKMHVDRTQKRGQFLITGSQQFTLMKGLKESLAGRVALFELLPMAIDEGPRRTQTYEFRGLTGSYPEIVSVPGINAHQWYGSYVSTYIEKDIQTHFQLDKITFFRDLLFLLAARCARLLNYQSLSNDLGVSVTAVKSWIKILETTGIIYLLRPFYVNLGSRIIKSPRIYFSDSGLVSYITGITNKTALMRGPQAGALFENFVIQEILKYFINNGKRPPLYFYRTNNGLEIDLIIEKERGHIIPCEIKLSKTPHSGMIRNIERFKNLNKKKDITIDNGYIISNPAKSFPLSKTIRACSLQEFIEKECGRS